MKLNLKFILAALIIVAEHSIAANPPEQENLRPGEIGSSPKGEFECFVKKQEGSGVALYVRNLKDQSSPALVWTTYRSLGIAWSPNSRWLAVLDHYLAGESAILIFDFGQKGSPLIYQTPFSKTEQDSWSVVSWNVKKKEVSLMRSRRFSSEPPLTLVVELKTNPVKPLLYNE